MNDYILVIGGLALLIVGGEFLVRGAVMTATRFGMSPLLIGLTLVGFGTSTPELVTSVEASLLNSPGIAIGNIVGSNIANILLILGVAAVISPIAVGQQALARDGVIVLATAAAFVAVAYLLPFDRLVGAAFVAGLVGYLCYAYRQESSGAPAGHTAAFAKREAHDEMLHAGTGTAAGGSAVAVAERISSAAWAPPLLALIGLVIVVLGGKLLVEGAVGIARSASISETVIGLTIVAIGTSLPELVTCIIAALRGHRDVALGNILGSNIYNILCVGGVTALIAPTIIPPEIVRFDSLVMLVASVALLVIARTGYRVARGEGVLLVGCYVAYLYATWPI